MQLDYESATPIFQQIAEGIEDAIVMGAFEEERQIPSVSDFSVMYKINPATALRGINILVDAGIVYKKRGIGMFVKEGAVGMLMKKRKESFFNDYVSGLVSEARKLGITVEELVEMLERGYEE